ncbi:hypothetical protein M8C21_001030, partial [Ambrosia artemisiifolia]
MFFFATGSFIALLWLFVSTGLAYDEASMTIDRAYPIFTVRWLVVHGLAVPICSSYNDKPNTNYRAMTQSNPNEQNVELSRTNLFWGLLLKNWIQSYQPLLGHHNLMKCGGKWRKWSINWKNSSLDNRYCSWYSCDRFSRRFLLWFIFQIGFNP